MGAVVHAFGAEDDGPAHDGHAAAILLQGGMRAQQPHFHGQIQRDGVARGPTVRDQRVTVAQGGLVGLAVDLQGVRGGPAGDAQADGDFAIEADGQRDFAIVGIAGFHGERAKAGLRLAGHVMVDIDLALVFGEGEVRDGSNGAQQVGRAARAIEHFFAL